MLVAAVLTLLLKKDQPAFAFLVSVCTAAGLLAIVVRQVQPLLDWLRTLDGYGMGGILADDMGLGKTLQVISFLLTEHTGCSLIVCPASLVYNWKHELERFAPSLKADMVTGNVQQRKDDLDRRKEVDV